MQMVYSAAKLQTIFILTCPSLTSTFFLRKIFIGRSLQVDEYLHYIGIRVPVLAGLFLGGGGRASACRFLTVIFKTVNPL